MIQKDIERKRGRRVFKSETTKNKTITLNTQHYDSLYDNKVELTPFARWLINNKQDSFIMLGSPSNNYEGNTEVTQISLYPSEWVKIKKEIVKGRSFSNFLKWGIDNFIEEYKENGII